MKIKRVFAKQINFPMGGKVWNPALAFQAKEVILVYVETDTDVFGVGEIWAFYGSSRSVVDLINHDIAPIVEGEDPHFIERIHAKVGKLAPIGSVEGILMNALSALDIALWDLRGKLLDTPLYKLLGAHSDKVYCYASGGLYGKGKTIADLKSEISGYIDQGFDAIKIKIGGVSIAEDVERITATREAAGPNAKVMIDAVHAYNVPEALELAKAVEELDIRWFESPVALTDFEGHETLNQRGGIPVCANESLYAARNYKRLLELDAVEYVHLDLGVCGGITEGLKIAALAEAYHKPCTFHAANGIHLFATSVHFGASISNLDSVEFHHVHQWMREHAPAETMELFDGPFLKPLERPGVGCDFLTPDFADKLIAEIEEQTS